MALKQMISFGREAGSEGNTLYRNVATGLKRVERVPNAALPRVLVFTLGS